jgi:hypothetical protein
VFQSIHSAGPVDRFSGKAISLARRRGKVALVRLRPQDTSEVPTQRYFHLHLASDSTGETLINVGRAAAAQYKQTHSIEHIHSLLRTRANVEKA